MAAPTETYIDPNIAGDSGAGTIGDPFGDCQYALDQVTRDAANGDRFNILTGTDEILAASLDLTSYGTPTAAVPLIFQGYTSAAADGGIGGISGNGANSMVEPSTLNGIWFVDMHLHNTGADAVIRLTNSVKVINCEINNSTSHGIRANATAIVVNCHIHDIGGIGAQLQAPDALVLNNFFEDETNVSTAAINLFNAGANSTIANNVIDKAATGNGIEVDNGCVIINNSIYASSSTGVGIDIQITGNDNWNILLSNIVEGFSGAGGIGYQAVANSMFILYGMNAAYNNTTNYSMSGVEIRDLGDNEVLSTSAFIDAANQDLTVDTTVKAAAWLVDDHPGLAVRTYQDKGALQRKEFPRVHPGYSGGLQ